MDRVGVATFTLDSYRDPLLSAILSAEHAIGVRHGCFCAHPLMTHLLGVPDAAALEFHADLRAGRHPAAPRRGARQHRARDHDRGHRPAGRALHELARQGPRASYAHVPEHDEYRAEECGRFAA